MASSPRAKKRSAPVNEAAHVSDTEQLNVIGRPKPLVFISHDSRDAEIAEAFANLLSDVSGGTLKSFRSSDKKSGSGIEFGTEWYNAIMSHLGDATDVVALLTQHSLDRPWILYEAGVAKGRLGTNVLGVALGVPLERVSTGPFGQFQNCDDTENSLTTLVMQLLERNPDASPREEAVRRQVTAFLENTKQLRVSGKKQSAPPETDESNVAKLFEEVKVMFRELPARVDERVQSFNGKRDPRRSRRFSPSMVEELSYHPAFEKKRYGPAAAWLLTVSLFRDEIPWFYEAGIEFYRVLHNGTKKSIEHGRNELLAILEIAMHGPLFDMYGAPDSDAAQYFLRRLPEVIHRLSERAMLTAPVHRIGFSDRSETSAKLEKSS
ncbi:toll/interleukin-1 receptor domain-containing protein [Paraburkholderia domus]|uniref:TIR domain-containing protein n=1 Tax=Paraburkholderia domus TaxID=2793075 RepID=A0A9N8MMQ5_9BURK|nr:toll/interleukin-1 receptor domain-containing protein [Paraburkholderia domus]MBK5164829.1 toll/interleukin-1 receptor domain-containing protein [Burkholderia sp. R-70211]CAE6872279.1 hypothetical protein R70211_01345 [Paraburkholderia domus]